MEQFYDWNNGDVKGISIKVLVAINTVTNGVICQL